MINFSTDCPFCRTPNSLHFKSGHDAVSCSSCLSQVDNLNSSYTYSHFSFYTYTPIFQYRNQDYCVGNDRIITLEKDSPSTDYFFLSICTTYTTHKNYDTHPNILSWETQDEISHQIETNSPTSMQGWQEFFLRYLKLQAFQWLLLLLALTVNTRPS